MRRMRAGIELGLAPSTRLAMVAAGIGPDRGTPQRALRRLSPSEEGRLLGLAPQEISEELGLLPEEGRRLRRRIRARIAQRARRA